MKVLDYICRVGVWVLELEYEYLSWEYEYLSTWVLEYILMYTYSWKYSTTSVELEYSYLSTF